MSAPRQRRAAAGAALGVLLLAGCGGAEAEKPRATATQPPADRTQRSQAGAQAALREYAAAFTTSNAARTCDLLDPTTAAMKSASKQRCRREVAKLTNVFTPADAASLRQSFATLRPVVSGNVATVPDNDSLTLRYIEGRWYVRLAPSAGASPPS